MPANRSVEGDVRAVGRGGDAVVETGEGVVLVPGALPGERVEFEPTSSKRGAARGRLIRVLGASAERREPACPDAKRCGGCPLMIASPDLQRDIKQGFVRTRAAGCPVPLKRRSNGSRRLRTSDTAAGRGSHGTVKPVGYRQLHSKRVTHIGECIVLMEPLRAGWNAVSECLASSLSGAGEIQLQLTSNDRIMVDLLANHEQPAELFEACETLCSLQIIAGVTLRTSSEEHAATWGETQVVIQTGEGASLEGPSGAFSQANHGVNAKLIEAVVQLAEPAGMRVLELHCGVGNFTVGLAAHAKTLVAVERDPRAVDACQRNLKRRGLRARVAVGDASQPPKGRYDVVVLDPPRQGARALFEHGDLLPGPKRVVYVSCDTATLARDLRLATAKGYRIDRLIGFDMFPQTAHLESLVRLVRA